MHITHPYRFKGTVGQLRTLLRSLRSAGDIIQASRKPNTTSREANQQCPDCDGIDVGCACVKMPSREAESKPIDHVIYKKPL